MDTTKKLIESDKRHLVHAIYPVGENPSRVFQEGNGVHLRDTDGKEYMDLCSQLDCVNLGYSQEELVAAATEQMQKLPYSTTFFGLSHRASVECALKLAQLTPEGLDHFFFTSGGSESIETAFKLARIYWNRQGLGKYKIISLYNSYHGVSIGAAGASGIGKGHMLRGISPSIPGFVHIPPFYCYRCMFGKVYPSCNIHCARFLAEIIEQEGPGTVAAFIAEPVIGTGGMIVPPPEYWPLVREICSKYDVLLIADEIKTGFCRTGTMFALEHWGIQPDVMVMAKGITSSYFPVGAVAFSDRIYGGIQGEKFSGFTYDGHPVGLAVAVKAMEIYERDRISEHTARLGQHLLDRLTKEFMPLPCIGEISGLGLMAALEIVADKTTKRLFDPALKVVDGLQARAFENGLYIRTTRAAYQMSDRLMLAPPLTISIEELDRALDILKPIIAGVTSKP